MNEATSEAMRALLQRNGGNAEAKPMSYEEELRRKREAARAAALERDKSPLDAIRARMTAKARSDAEAEVHAALIKSSPILQARERLFPGGFPAAPVKQTPPAKKRKRNTYVDDDDDDDDDDEEEESDEMEDDDDDDESDGDSDDDGGDVANMSKLTPTGVRLAGRAKAITDGAINPMTETIAKMDESVTNLYDYVRAHYRKTNAATEFPEKFAREIERIEGQAATIEAKLKQVRSFMSDLADNEGTRD